MSDGMEKLLDMAKDYHEPPETPRDEMWAVIRAELPRQAGTEGDDLARRRSVRSRTISRWTPWVVGLAAAATLAVGFGLGRLTEGTDGAPPANVAAEQGPSRPLQLAAAEHMSDAEALLTMYRSGSAVDREGTAAWARDLLSTTRLLMDSRAGQDPELSGLLDDLELVLVQIAAAGGTEDDQMIEEGIQQQDLLTKLRTAAAPADYAL